MIHLIKKFTARLPISYYFTVRPFVFVDWTGGGANEEVLNQFTMRAICPKRKSTLTVVFIITNYLLLGYYFVSILECAYLVSFMVVPLRHGDLLYFFRQIKLKRL